MTSHVFERAATGRSKCRGCGRPIAKGDLRFGERLPNLYGDGEMTHWHHPRCAAYRRPAALAEALAELDYPDDDRDTLQRMAAHSGAHPRLQRLGAAEQASSGRARCRHCRELIEQGTWRLPLIFFEEGAYNTSGFIHADCARGYCGTDAVEEAILCFATGLSADEVTDMVEPGRSTSSG